jgi:hypothetical protein
LHKISITVKVQRSVWCPHFRILFYSKYGLPQGKVHSPRS